MKKYIIGLLLIYFPFTMPAQDKKWTLKECIEFGSIHSSGVKKQQAQVDIYKQNYKEAIGGLLPSIKAIGDASMSFGRVLDKDNYSYVNTNTLYNDYSLYASVTVFDGFSQIAKVRMERMNRMKGVEQLQLTKDMLAYETTELFFNVQYYMGTVDLAKGQLQESLANLDKAKKMEELGLKSQPDVAEMEAQAAQNRFLLVKQQNMLKQGIILLKAKINFPIDSELQVENRDSLLLVDSTSDKALDIYRQALGYSPKALAAVKSLNASRLAVGVAQGHLFPTLSLYGGYGTYFTRLMNGVSYGSFRQQISDNQSSYVGLTLSIPIFTGFSGQAELKRSKLQLRMAQSDYDDTLRSLYSDIEQAVADVNGKAEEYIHANKQTESMTVAHQANVRKFELGMISALEINTSANRLLQAKIDELNANLQYQLKHRLLDYYKGQGF